MEKGIHKLMNDCTTSSTLHGRETWDD